MAEERNSVDILIDNLAARGIKCETQNTSQRFVLPNSARMMSTKYVVAFLDSCFFFAYDSYAAKAQTTLTFSGIYAAVYLPAEAECKIYKKEWADRFFRCRKRKTGIKFIDDNLTITSGSGWTPSTFLSFADVSLFLELNKHIGPLKMIIQHDYMPLIADLKGKTVVGIETNSWLYEKKDLDIFINKGMELVNRIGNSVRWV